MKLKYLLKTILIAILIYAASILLTTFIVRFTFIPIQILMAIEPSFFLAYLYGQFMVTNTLRKGIVLNKIQKLRVYLFVWLFVVVLMTIINYFVY